MNPHVLIVDDNLKNLQIVGKILKDQGYSISLAQSGRSALEIIGNQLPDIMLFDIMMPEMCGFELCRIVKSNELLKDIPVIFLTAKNQNEDLIEGFKIGGVDYITKPFNSEELLIRLKTHMDLAMSKKKIVELNATRDKLYSIISHDLRSPLDSISMATGALAGGLLDVKSDDFKEIIEFLDREVKATSNLLNNLLEWTRIQNGSMLLNMHKQPVHTVLAGCLELLQPLAAQKSIDIEQNVSEELTAVFDQISMHTVFRNIISNAIKFTGENGRIFISATNEGEFTTITIQDNGIGMTQEIVKKILYSNEMYSTSGTRNERGSGLGLMVVKDFIAKNNGRVEIISEPEKGTTFRISLFSTVQKV